MKLKISAIEKYLPQQRISSSTLDKVVKGKVGRIEKNTGVQYRHHISRNESVCEMGAIALQKALKSSDLSPSDIDMLIFAGASFDYPVPHNSVIIKSKITDDSVNFSCLDVDTTCLSFLNALDIAHLYIQAGRYTRLAIVCSEVASSALTPHEEKVFGLFGDAAVAAVIEVTENKGYQPVYIDFQNYPSGAFHAHIPIGGVIDRGFERSAEDPGYYFKMDGKNLIKLVNKQIFNFIHKMEEQINCKISDFDRIITHQTSKYGNNFFLNNFKLDHSRVVETLSVYGNCISASIPLGLESLLNSSYSPENKKILLLGIGAGLTIGGMVLEFS